jgi:serine/threonine-protein kinase
VSRKENSSPVSAAPARGWATLVALGALSALWSLFLWAELVLSRSGAGSFCGPGGELDCSAVWDGTLASAVHRLTGLPVAGWGLVWSTVAFALPLVGLARRAEGRPVPVLTSAVRLTAGAGILAVLALIAAVVAAGAICVLCMGTYVLVGGYAAIALVRWRSVRLPEAGRGLVLAGAATAAAFFLLLYPGLRTPRSSGEAGRRAIAQASEQLEPRGAPARAGTSDSQRDEALEQLITTMDPAQRQTLADSLAIFRSAPQRMLPAARALVGSDLAPVRITEFTDILCEHCASLYETLETLRAHTPPGSFSVDARQFPLDGRCNPVFRAGTGDEVRCVAAKARICVEPTGREPEFARALFANQKGLTAEKVFELARPYVARESLSACLDSSATRAKLEQDITAAMQFESDGTPIVVVNGRRGTSFGPFLYAMVLTRANANQPAFDPLPPGNPAAHLH